MCTSIARRESSPARKAYQREYRRKHQQAIWEKHGQTWGEVRAQRRKELRDEIFSHYGKECACCGESTAEFLTIDHINGNGNQERQALGVKGGTHFYAYLKREDFPPGYQTLCFNCNCSKGFWGYCPHQHADHDRMEINDGPDDYDPDQD